MKITITLLGVLAAAVAAQAVDFTTLDGKVLRGYQGWFNCPGDGATNRGWRIWANNTPSAKTLTLDMYPKLSEFNPSDLCSVPGFTVRGRQAFLYSAMNSNVVDRHFLWMKDYGLDGVLIQRFVVGIPARRSGGDVVLKNILQAAQGHGRTIAIEYDVTGASPKNFFETMRDDWKYLVTDLKVTSHPCYLHHRGKPVLSVWGMGLSESRHVPRDPETALRIVKWFQDDAPPEQRVSYMGGVPARWRTLTRDAMKQPGWRDVYARMDVVQPWCVGCYTNGVSGDRWQQEVIEPDLAKTNENGQLYMPVVFPGFSWANLKRDTEPNQIPRNGGRLVWTQAWNARQAGARMLKIAMFDEVNESTAVLKVAAKRQDAPEQGFWPTLHADSENLPSDWYLKASGEITTRFQGEPDSPAFRGNLSHAAPALAAMVETFFIADHRNGREVFRALCPSCPTLDGYQGIRRLLPDDVDTIAAVLEVMRAQGDDRGAATGPAHRQGPAGLSLHAAFRRHGAGTPGLGTVPGDTHRAAGASLDARRIAMNPNLVPPLDPTPVPGPFWLFHALLVFTFFLHALFMNLALGGTLLAAVAQLGGRTPERLTLARRLMGVNGYGISFAITTGIAPLLFVQVLYQQYFYAATILIGEMWLLFVALLMLGYYAVWLSRSLTQ